MAKNKSKNSEKINIKDKAKAKFLQPGYVNCISDASVKTMSQGNCTITSGATFGFVFFETNDFYDKRELITLPQLSELLKFENYDYDTAPTVISEFMSIASNIRFISRNKDKIERKMKFGIERVNVFNDNFAALNMLRLCLHRSKIEYTKHFSQSNQLEVLQELLQYENVVEILNEIEEHISKLDGITFHLYHLKSHTNSASELKKKFKEFSNICIDSYYELGVLFKLNSDADNLAGSLISLPYLDTFVKYGVLNQGKILFSGLKKL